MGELRKRLLARGGGGGSGERRDLITVLDGWQRGKRRKELPTGSHWTTGHRTNLSVAQSRTARSSPNLYRGHG